MNKPYFGLNQINYAMLVIFGLAICYVSAAMAEDDEWDFEAEFGIKRKSTLADFPLEEADPDLLSEAVIQGSLQVTGAGTGAAKPAFEEQEEEEAVSKQRKLELKEEPVNVDELIRFGQITPLEPAAEIRPYQTDPTRVMDNNFVTVER